MKRSTYSLDGGRGSWCSDIYLVSDSRENQKTELVKNKSRPVYRIRETLNGSSKWIECRGLVSWSLRWVLPGYPPVGLSLFPTPNLPLVRTLWEGRSPLVVGRVRRRPTPVRVHHWRGSGNKTSGDVLSAGESKNLTILLLKKKITYVYWNNLCILYNMLDGFLWVRSAKVRLVCRTIHPRTRQPSHLRCDVSSFFSNLSVLSYSFSWNSGDTKGPFWDLWHKRLESRSDSIPISTPSNPMFYSMNE